MWEMFLVGFFHSDHAAALKNISINAKATGVASIFGNKGGL
jgi:hypothetical protein